MKITPIILAAGQGTRMKSSLPKVLHCIGGKPLIQWALDAAARVGTELPVVVVGHGADAVRAAVGSRARFAVQEKQLGTADAVRAAAGLVEGQTDLVVVTYADMPLLSGETLEKLTALQLKNSGPFSMLTVTFEDSHGFGRVVRGADGSVTAIVEEAQATPEQLEIHELNAGVYCFRSDWLWAALRAVKVSPKGEYYLTDLVEMASSAGLRVEALALDDPYEAMGINNRQHLAEAEAILRTRINQHWLLAGVTMIDPEATYIEPDVQIGRDSVLYPNTVLRGKTVVGEGCILGPNTVLTDAQIGANSRIIQSYVTGRALPENSSVGPFEVYRE